MSSENFVTSLQKGLSVLEAFTPDRPVMKLQDLTSSTGMPKTTVFRLLRTLTSLNYLRFNTTTREYSLGPKAMSLGYTTLASLDLREIARSYLEELSRLSGQNVNLGILDGAEVVYIDRITKKQLIKTDHTVGSRVSVHATALGRAILAYLNREEFEKIWKKMLANPVEGQELGTKHEEFLGMLKEVRRKGYSLNNEEFIKGIRAIGAPIFNARREIKGAINMPVFSKSVSVKQLTSQYAPMLISTAERISASVA